MMDTSMIWRRRMNSFRQEVIRYAPYMGNSGTLTFLVLVMLFGSYYYAQLLQHLPKSYPYEWGIALLFSLLVTRGSIRTFLQAGDLVFMLPLESKLDHYFNHAIRYSMVVSAIPLLIFLIVVWPLYTHRQGEQSESFWLSLVVLLLLKLLNLLAGWCEQRLRERSQRMLYLLIRWVANTSVLLVFFSRGLIWPFVILTTAFLVAAWFYYRGFYHYYLNWQRLVEREGEMRNRFYSVVNWFVDVPQLSQRVHRRSLFSSLLDLLPYRQSHTYHYLYGKTFIRSDLFGMFWRLAVIGLILITWIPDQWGKLAAFFIILYMTGMQLSVLAQFHRYSFWFELFPVPQRERFQAISDIVKLVMGTQALILLFAMFLSTSWNWALLIALLLAVGLPLLYSRRLYLRLSVNNL